jgi:tetratricopeptide (TPR) repeat protein
MSVPVLENELKSYVRRGDFSALRIASADPQAYASYTAMQRSSLTDAEANYYLGDLLFHIDREADAERYFKQAIAQDANFLPPYASLGLINVYRRRYADAKKYLERAVTSSQSHLIHYLYAYVLSREGVSPNGHVTDYSRENAALMREHLLKSIKLSSEYAPAYYLLALVDLVTSERLDEAIEMARKGQRLAPSKASYSLLLAQIHLRRSEPAEARAILETLTRNSETAVRSEAQSLLDSLNQKNTTAGSNRSASGSSRVRGAMIAEPTESRSTSRIMGGSSSGVEVRDGRTISSSGSMPSVDDVLARSVEAMGGAAAINAVSTRVIKGTVDVAGVSRGGSFETYGLAPGKLLTVIQPNASDTIKIGFNGKGGWLLSGGAVSALKGGDLAALQREADFYAPLRTKINFAKVTMPGMSKIGYRDVYVLDLEPAVGPAERLYLDAETYLPVRINTTRTVGRGKEPVEIYLDDWRTVDGIKYPFSTSQSSPSLKLGFTVKEIRHNVPVDAKMFEPPR